MVVGVRVGREGEGEADGRETVRKPQSGRPGAASRRRRTKFFSFVVKARRFSRSSYGQ